MTLLDRTQEIFAIWNSRDFEGLIPLVTDDVEWRPATMAAVEGGSFKGVGELQEFFDEWDRSWTTWEVTPGDIREEGNRVLVLGQVHAAGRGSGLELDQPVAYLFEFRGDLLAYGATFFDHDQAIQAAQERAGQEGVSA